MKKFKISQEQLVMLTANTNVLRNHFIYEMNIAQTEELRQFYQKEIDKINSLFDELNLELKTSF